MFICAEIIYTVCIYVDGTDELYSLNTIDLIKKD